MESESARAVSEGHLPEESPQESCQESPERSDGTVRVDTTPDLNDKRSEAFLARKRQIMALEALEEAVKVQRCILVELREMKEILREKAGKSDNSDQSDEP